MKNTAKFIEDYRKLETVLRDNDSDYKMLEDNADDFIQGRLRICRQMRNYLTHQDDDGFLDISDKQIAFIENETREQAESGDILKKHLKTVKASCCTKQDLISDVFSMMNRLSLFHMPVLDDSRMCIGLLSIHDAVKAYMASGRPKTVKVKSVSSLIPLSSELFFPPTEKMENIPFDIKYGFILCTDNGETNGKVLGLYLLKHEFKL